MVFKLMCGCFALVPVLVQILLSGKEAAIFVAGKESHSALLCGTKHHSLLVGRRGERNAAGEKNYIVVAMLLESFHFSIFGFCKQM